MYVRQNGFGVSRLGITASRKVGNAIRRNRWKRRIREIFRRNRELWPECVDIVVIVKGRRSRNEPVAPEPEFDLVRDELLGLATRFRSFLSDGD